MALTNKGVEGMTRLENKAARDASTERVRENYVRDVVPIFSIVIRICNVVMPIYQSLGLVGAVGG